MKLPATLLMFAMFALVTAPGFAQEPVVGVANPESLFTDKNPKLDANKQAALHIMKDLLQCNHWDEAETWLTGRDLTPTIAPISAKELHHAEAEISATGGDGPDRMAGERRVRECTNRDRDAAGCRSR